MRSVNALRRVKVWGPANAGRQGIGYPTVTPLRLAQWTASAALVEFLLLRVAMRLGPLLPHESGVLRVAAALMLVGTTALNVAAILSIVGLWLIARQTSSPLWRSLLVACGVLTLARLAVRSDDAIFLLYTGAALGAMALAVAWSAVPGWQRGLLALLLAVYALLAYPVSAASATRLGWPWPKAAGLFFVAEGLAVGCAWFAPLAYRSLWGRRNLLTALAATVVVGAFWLARPWLALTFAQWTVGFTGFLPFWLYLVAIFLFTSTVSGLARRRHPAAWGLLLVAVGGLHWDYSYLSGLGLLGFLVLAQPWTQKVAARKGSDDEALG